MLVLSRKAEDKIMIGDDIEVTVVRIEGNRVRLGINAPREMRILRGELTEAAGASKESDYELSEREFAFAHQNVADRMKSVNQPTTRPSNRQASPTQLFTGTVAADGSKVQLTSDSESDSRKAPLSSFVSAS